MLGSFGSPQEEDQEGPSSSETHHYPHLHHHHQQIQPPTPPPPRGFATSSIHARQLLISIADLIQRSDFAAAHRLTAILSSNSASPYGDSTERLVHQFTQSLSLRLSATYPPNPFLSHPNIPNPITAPPLPPNNLIDIEPDQNLLHSAYLILNQVTPFIRFGHLTANQAILEAVDGTPSVHIIDFDIMHGFQWPLLMQSLAERYPPPTVRITGTGTNLELLRRTGDHLSKFAHSLGLRFQFHPLLLHCNQSDPVTALVAAQIPILPDETLAVNCVLYLHQLLSDRERIGLFLRRIKGMNPRVVTVVEREANHNHPVFLNRVVEAVEHYAAVFESLEATLPPSSKERMDLEVVWFGREIRDIVVGEGSNRRERHEKFPAWEMLLRSSGFSNVDLSHFALSQAKLLLRLHYPSEGYQLRNLGDCFVLGWQNRPLFSVSSWR
ncbi:scarecrow-like protein 18 [Rhododendron vialii]|uniref:scarecrow-like protein 18 n=1 Tax=Rhododendron vialii TaxID=182163 RepID=UPI0026602C03|nr:scarecrow-like protein 18 [Rhododendron vialii]